MYNIKGDTKAGPFYINVKFYVRKNESLVHYVDRADLELISLPLGFKFG